MRKGKRKLLVYSLLILFAMAFTWHSCTKQEEVTTNNTKELRDNFRKNENVLSERNIVSLLKESGLSVTNELEELDLRNTGSADCGTNQDPGVTCFDYGVDGFISVPPDGNTPGCDQTYVSFTIDVCIDNVTGQLVSFSFSDFNAYPVESGLGCGDLWQYWFRMDSEDAYKSIDAFIYRASLIVEEMMAGVLVGTDIACPNTYATSNFSRDLCYRICYTPINEPPFIHPEQIRCGEGCCKRTTEWCRNDDGELESSGPVFEKVGECEPWVPQPCTGWLSPTCEHECGPITEN